MSAPLYLHEYMAKTTKRAALALAFSVVLLAVLLVWMGIAGVQKSQASVGQGVIAGTMQNIASYCLFLAYHSLSGKRPESDVPRSPLASPLAWLLSLLSLMVFHLLAWATSPATHVSLAALQVAYGLGLSVGIFLLTGRLDSFCHAKYLATAQPLFWLYLRRVGVVSGYLWAGFWPLLTTAWIHGPEELCPLAIGGGVACVVWCGFLLWLFKPNAGLGGVRPVVLHAYEMERFANEDASSFQRHFLHKHFALEYAHRVNHEKTGFLGVEYEHLNGFKRTWMHLGEEQAGLLITEVHAGGGAMRAGIRCGDVITRIDGVPLGPREGPRAALFRAEPFDRVDVDTVRWSDRERAWLRRSCSLVLSHYDSLLRAHKLPCAHARLGWTFVQNSPLHGVVCFGEGGASSTFTITGLRSELSRRWFCTADKRLLDIALGQLTPGEIVEVEYDGTSAAQVRFRPLRSNARSAAGVDGHVTVECLAEEGEPGWAAWAFVGIRVRHPDRFHPDCRVQATGLDWAWTECRVRVLCFDSRLRLVFDVIVWVRGAETVLGQLKRLGVWGDLGAQRFYVFAAQCDADAYQEDASGVRVLMSGTFGRMSIVVK